MTQRRVIRWLIAHYPAYLFIRTAKKFNEELEKLCPGEFAIEIHTLESYVKKYKGLEDLLLVPPAIPGLETENTGTPSDRELAAPRDSKKKWVALFNALRDGQFELSQTQINIIGHHLHPNFNAIDLPFLFNNHDHVSSVLDNEIGDELCEQLSRDTEIRGLGFTYSGGYRVIGSSHEIKNLTDLASTTLMTTTKPSYELFKELGTPILSKRVVEVSDFGDLRQNGAIETTYLRFAGKHVLKTDHSMFMTSILTGEKFWNTLTSGQQDAFKTAAKIVAKAEREWSVADAAKYEQDAESNGVTINTISEEDHARLVSAAQASYRAATDLNIDVELVKRIIEKGSPSN